MLTIFKHIRRLDEPNPVEMPKPIANAEWGKGYFSCVISDVVRHTLTEEQWMESLFERALRTGYSGTIAQFFCRDLKQEKWRGGPACSVCYTWKGGA